MKRYTPTEVAKKSFSKGSKELWVIIAGEVFDVTSFVREHPGGAFVIRSSSGKDATKEFESMGAMGHPESAKARLQKMKIGVVES